MNPITFEALNPRVHFSTTPHFLRIVVVIEENHSYEQIFAPSSPAMYIKSVAAQAALMTNSFGNTHPSQGNYFALFAGSTFGVHDDGNHTINEDNLGAQLKRAGKTFIGYAESPSERKHKPWESFPTSASLGKNFSSFPSDFNQLPAVSFVVPNDADNMHDGKDPARIAKGDKWLKDHLDAYRVWAKTHNSALVIKFDEDNGSKGNHIVEIIDGQGVVPGEYSDKVTHYNTLGLLEDSNDLPHLKNTQSFPDIFNGGPTIGATVSGNVMNQATHTGISGETIYLDLNNNSKLDAGERSTVTDELGNFIFDDVAAGNPIVRQIVASGFRQVTPRNNYGVHLQVTSGQYTANFVNTSSPVGIGH